MPIKLGLKKKIKGSKKSQMSEDAICPEERRACSCNLHTILFMGKNILEGQILLLDCGGFALLWLSCGIV
jgi:hypothetical protein